MATDRMLVDVRDAKEAILSSGSIDDVRRRTLDAVEGYVTGDVEFVLRKAAVSGETGRSGDETGALAASGTDPDAVVEAIRSREPVQTTAESGDDDTGHRSILVVPVGRHGYLEVVDEHRSGFDDETVAAIDLLATFAVQVLDPLVAAESTRSAAEGASNDPSAEAVFPDQPEGYSTLVDRFPNGIVTMFDTDLRYRIVGGRGFEDVALSPGDMEDRRLSEVFPSENVDELEPLYRRALEGESSVTEEELDGRIFRIHVVPVRNREGSVVAGMTMSQDVTERRAIEAELREREVHLLQAQEIADLGSWQYDLRGDDLQWSERCYEMFGVPQGETIDYERFLDFVHPEDRDYVAELWQSALAGEAYDIEHRIVVDGETRWVREKAEVEFGEDGDPRCAIGVVQEITDRHERERELEAARKRYETLLQAAPDPIFVVDVETRGIIEVNEAAADLRGQTKEEIVGLNLVDLHPPEDAEAYRTLFDRGVRDGGTRRWLDDGSPIHTVTGRGEAVPVEISVGTIELEEGPVIYGIFRDVSDQLEYERALTRLNEATRRLFDAQSDVEIATIVAEAATEVVDDMGAAVYLFDEEPGVLIREGVAGPDEVVHSIGEPATFEPGEGLTWRVYSSGEPAVYDDVRNVADFPAEQTQLRSAILLPIPGEGVILVGATRRAAFDERAVELLEVLHSAVGAALERVEREQRLRQREFELNQYTAQLERVEALNRHIRNVARAIVQSETRTEVEETVCAQLVEDETSVFAWIGRVDQADDVLVPMARAGKDQGYLEQVSFSLEDDLSQEPAIRAAKTGKRVVVDNSATDMASEEWRSEAVMRGYRSIISIPLVYQDTLQGVLTLYGDETSAFEGAIQSVLSELSDLVAHAVVANDRKRAILTNQATELEFEIRDHACLFLRFAQETNCTLELEGIIPQADESTLVFVKVRDGSADDLVDAAQRTPAVDSARRIEANDRTLVQLRFVEPFIASILADQGVVLRDISADDRSCRITVAVPPTLDVRHAVDVVSSTYPDSELLAKREGTETFDSVAGLGQRFLEKLTPRQWEVIELAYLSGYFDSPKGASGKEIAEELEFSTSAFHHHVREAERKLLETVFEEEVVTPPRHADEDD